MPEAAFAVHGLGDDFLRDKPLFAAVARGASWTFIGDARLVIHNASFDMKFLNHELGRLGHPPMPMDRAIDTVLMARRQVPGRARLARRALPAVRDRQLGPDAARGAARQRAPGRGLPGADRRPAAGPGAAPRPRRRAAAGRGGRTGPWRPRPRPAPLPPRITEEEADGPRRLRGGPGRRRALVADLGTSGTRRVAPDLALGRGAWLRPWRSARCRKVLRQS